MGKGSIVVFVGEVPEPIARNYRTARSYETLRIKIRTDFEWVT
jgi:hypothetical protein